MSNRKNVLAIIGSASRNSSNLKLVQHIAKQLENDFNWEIFDSLHELPHFNPELSVEGTPKTILEFREQVNRADGVLICTPEYVYSIPSGLKNALEWCVSTTVFSDKPTALITASAHGQKGHDELKLIMETIQAHVPESCALLIQGVKGKINAEGIITDQKTKDDLDRFITAFSKLMHL